MYGASSDLKPGDPGTRTSVCFRSAFRGDWAPCISHETGDGITTYCGRDVATAEEVVVEDQSLHPFEPDCLICSKRAQRIKAKETR